MIYIGLKRGTGFYSQLIRLWTRSKYSHALIAHDDGGHGLQVYEATAKNGTIKRRATVSQLIREGVELYPSSEVFGNVHRLPKYVINSLENEIGTGYDWTAIFYSRVFSIDRQDAKKWFCFELVAWAFGMQKAWRWTGRTFEDKLERVI